MLSIQVRLSSSVSVQKVLSINVDHWRTLRKINHKTRWDLSLILLCVPLPLPLLPDDKCVLLNFIIWKDVDVS